MMTMKMMAKKTMIWCTLIIIMIFLIINIILIFSPLSSSPESNWSFAITASDPLVHLQPCSSNWVNIAIINCTINQSVIQSQPLSLKLLMFFILCTPNIPKKIQVLIKAEQIFDHSILTPCPHISCSQRPSMCHMQSESDVEITLFLCQLVCEFPEE